MVVLVAHVGADAFDGPRFRNHVVPKPPPAENGFRPHFFLTAQKETVSAAKEKRFREQRNFCADRRRCSH